MVNIILNTDICYYISLFISKKFKLLDWIDINKLNWSNLSSNPNAIELLKENQDKINWNEFSYNINIFKEINITKMLIKAFII